MRSPFLHSASLSVDTSQVQVREVPLFSERLDMLCAASPSMDSGLRLENKEVDNFLVSASPWQFSFMDSVLAHAVMVDRTLHIALV